MPRRAGQTPLTADRIFETALAIVDQQSLDALSMRRLAKALDVDPMAIYHHVPNKEALLHGLVARVFEQGLPSELAGDNWQAQLRAWAEAYRALALKHPNLVLRIVGDPQAAAIAAHHAGQPLTSPGDDRAMGVLTDYVNGFVLGEASGAMTHADQSFAFGLDVILAGLSQRRRTDRRSGT